MTTASLTKPTNTIMRMGKSMYVIIKEIKKDDVESSFFLVIAKHYVRFCYLKKDYDKEVKDEKESKYI